MDGASWWDGLKQRLFRRGLYDPFTARHVRADFTPFAEEWAAAVRAGEEPITAFHRVFLGNKPRST